MFQGRFKLTRDDLYGALGICLLVIIITGVVIYNNRNRAIEMGEEMNREFSTRIDSLPKPKPFDPNTVELRELLTLGLTKNEALSILRYRASGKVFHIKEELYSCYGIGDSLYFALEPYIVIGDEFKYKRRSYEPKSSAQHEAEVVSKLELSPFMIDTIGVRYLTATGLLTTRQAEVFVKWREMSGIHSMDELRGCYTVSDSIASVMEPYAIFTPHEEFKIDESNPYAKRALRERSHELVDLNRADSAELVSLYGVGAKSAAAIIEYREKLRGFYCKEQLLEIKMVSESNFERIFQQIFVDSCDISKIDINFASAKVMLSHPYFSKTTIRRITRTRQLEGGWSTIREMIDDDIFDEEEAQLVRPYIRFD